MFCTICGARKYKTNWGNSVCNQWGHTQRESMEHAFMLHKELKNQTLDFTLTCPRCEYPNFAGDHYCTKCQSSLTLIDKLLEAL